jgi:hypothetical protein
MRTLVLLFASSLALVSAQAGEIAKQGDDLSTIYFVEIATDESAGIKRTNNGDAMFDSMAVRSTAHGGLHGDLVMIDADGDQIFATWEAWRVALGPRDREIQWHFRRGHLGLPSP